MKTREKHTVTGALGYSGKYIAKRLLLDGKKVTTLTNSLNNTNPFNDSIEISPFYFDQPEKLVMALEETKVLYITYWVRFNHSTFHHSTAVQNTITLFDAAKKAGVERIVHVSITNPSRDSELEYFHGKAVLEDYLKNLGIPYTILRPTVLFGTEDILINNIAWLARKFPFFGVFGDGNYRLQPIFVDDLAKLAVEAGEATGNETINAIGKETYTFTELVRTIMKAIGKKRRILHINPRLGYLIGKPIGWIKGDVVITWPEVKGLMADLLYVTTEPTGETSMEQWCKENAATLGKKYASELGRRKGEVRQDKNLNSVKRVQMQ